MSLAPAPSGPSLPEKGPIPWSALVVALVTAAVHIGLDAFYRPWAWANEISDFGVANSFTNLTAVIGLSAVMVLWERRRLWVDPWQSWLVVVAPIVAMVAYEFLQLFLPMGTFSATDLIYSLVGGLAVVPIKRRVYNPSMTRL
jgi:glycopeptide antibiotics resistance protein